MTNTRWALLALVALGAFLRFYRLDVQSLWVDELLTIGAAEVGGRLGPREFFGNIQGPLHALLVHVVSRISASAFALRSISVVAGVASIPVCYLLGKTLVDKRTGLLTALLLTVSPFAVWYSQELRNYSLLMFLSSVASLLLWRLVMEEGRSWATYVSTAVLSVYCNLSGAFLVFSHAIFAAPRALTDKRFLRRAGTAFAVVVLLALPMTWGLARWVAKEEVAEQATFAPGAEASELRRGETTFVPMAVPYSIFAIGYGFSLGPGIRELHVAAPGDAFRESAALTVPAGLALAGALLVGMVRLAGSRRRLSFALVVMLVPLAAACALALANVKPVNPRYVAVALPVFLVTAAAGISSLRRPLGGLLCAVIVLFCGVSLRGHYFDPQYWKEDVRASAYYVQLNEEPGDVVLVPVVLDVFNHYYGGSSERVVFHRGQAGSESAVRERIKREVGEAGRLWYVSARSWEVDPDGRIAAYLGESFELLDENAFTGVSVTLYELEGRPEPVHVAGHHAR